MKERPVSKLEKAELGALRDQLADALPTRRFNADPEDVQRSVARLVLGLVEFLRKVLERQAIRRMDVSLSCWVRRSAGYPHADCTSKPTTGSGCGVGLGGDAGSADQVMELVAPGKLKQARFRVGLQMRPQEVEGQGGKRCDERASGLHALGR